MRWECREHFPRHRPRRKPLVSDPHMRHARAVMHAAIANPRLWGKRSRHSRRMCNPQIYVSGKRPMLRFPNQLCSEWQVISEDMVISNMSHVIRMHMGLFSSRAVVLEWGQLIYIAQMRQYKSRQWTAYDLSSDKRINSVNMFVHDAMGKECQNIWSVYGAMHHKYTEFNTDFLHTFVPSSKLGKSPFPAWRTRFWIPQLELSPTLQTTVGSPVAILSSAKFFFYNYPRQLWRLRSPRAAL